jgi:hypothetical protein
MQNNAFIDDPAPQQKIYRFVVLESKQMAAVLCGCAGTRESQRHFNKLMNETGLKRDTLCGRQARSA